MKVRMCPLCDSEMKKAHRCDVCGSFIWHPEIVDIHYNAETRNKGEVDCAYGDSHDYYDHEDVDKNYKRTRKKSSGSHAEVFGAPVQRTRTSEEDTEKKKGGFVRKIVFSVIGLNIICSLLTGVFNVIADYGSEEEIIQQLEEIFGGDIVYVEEENDYDDNYIAIPDEELDNYADGCTGYAHLDMIKDEFLKVFEPWLYENYGDADDIEVETSSDNYQFVYADGDKGYVWLQSVNRYFLPGDEYKYFEVNFDSASEQMHSVMICNLSVEETKTAMEAVIDMLNVDADGLDYDSVIDQAMASDNGYVGEMYGDIYLYIAAYDDGTTWVEISSSY